MRLNHLFILLAASSLIFITLSFTNNSDQFRENRNMIALRSIGHQILLGSGDSVSRVLPIREVSASVFEISFENPVNLESDKIVDIIKATVNQHGLPREYSVNIRQNTSNEIVYGFVIANIDSNSLVPCLGRQLPVESYSIIIRFSNQLISDQESNYYIAGGFGAIAIVSLFGMGLYSRKKKVSDFQILNTVVEEKQTPPLSNILAIGKYQFNIAQQHLEINGERNSLTGKEAQLLQIFAKSPNEVIERSLLQKQVWEDEGVIVTRSLDMFVSKLRKKLEGDSSIKILNVHGKGYKLEIATV